MLPKSLTGEMIQESNCPITDTASKTVEFPFMEGAFTGVQAFRILDRRNILNSHGPGKKPSILKEWKSEDSNEVVTGTLDLSSWIVI